MSSEIVIDCANLDGVLGYEILREKPSPWDRPRYDRLHTWSQETLGEPARVIAVMTEGVGATRLKRQKFAQALHMMKVRVVFAESYAAVNALPRSHPQECDDDVVAHLLKVSAARSVIYVGHDFSAAAALREQRERGKRVYAACFPEYLATEIIDVVEEAYDLEHDIRAFQRPLPRVWVSGLALT